MPDPRGDEPTVAAGATRRAEGDSGELPLAARVANRWEILALIGTGGMGNVYRARDTELGEDVALKVLREVGGERERERFRQEVKLARRITHRNVARTHDIGHHGDGWFLTMELVDGEPLSDRLMRGPTGWRDAVAIARAIAAGVAAAHAAGVVHRDLKPENVLLARDGRVVVTDFGIAAVQTVAAGGGEVEVTGTPAWMAPEQLTGQSDARSDVYAIGEILHAMLAGAHPWLRDGRIETAARLDRAAPALPVGTAPVALAAVVARCLAREPGARWADAAELGRALEAAEAEILTGATPPRPVAPAPARAREVRIGVRPLRNLGDPADEFVAAGLVEDLIDMFGRASGVRVRLVAEGEAAPELDVVVEGSMRRAGELVRITVRAVGAADGFQIWGQRFDRRLDEILKVSDEVAREVATALSATSAHVAAGRDVATDRVVVELYLRARQIIETSWFDDPRVITLLQTALEHAPDSPAILAAYAAQMARRIYGVDETASAEAEREAEGAARRAIAHGPDLGEPWVALAVVYYNQRRTVPAIRAARIALDRAPGLAEAADMAGRILVELDPDLTEAIALLERAHWSNPRLPTNLLDLTRAHALRGDWARVDELLGGAGPSTAALAIARGRLAVWRGAGMPHWPEQIAGFERINWVARAVAEILGAGSFPPEVAGAWRHRLSALTPSCRARRYFAQVGCELALRVGDLPVAREMLAEAVDHGLNDVAWMDRMPLLPPLRAEPAFAAQRARVAARAAIGLAAWRAPLGAAAPDTWTEWDE